MADLTTEKIIQNAVRDGMKHAAEQIKDELDEAAEDVMNEFYADYSPKYYERTNNLRNAHKSEIHAEYTNKRKETLNVTASLKFSPEFMVPYKHNERFVEEMEGGYNADDSNSSFGAGWTFDEVNPAIVFDLDFLQGYHGGKNWQNTRYWIKGNKAHGQFGMYSTAWQPAARMVPSPKTRMDAKFDVMVRPGGFVSKLLNSPEFSETIINAAFAALNAEFGKINAKRGGK